MSDERDAATDQPLPEVNDRPFIQDLVLADIEDRKQFGINKYGTALQTGNGRDMTRDAYEEAMDLVVYLRGLMEEDHEILLELQKVRKERSELRDVMFRLAAPLEYATDGTTQSVIHNLTTYVRQLESEVVTLKAQSRKSPDEIVASLQTLLDETFADGSSVIEYVLATNPPLARRLREWMEQAGA